MGKIKKIIKKNKYMYSFLEKIVDTIRCIEDNTINRFYWNIYCKKPIKNNKIVICNFYGKGFSDNLKYIANEMLYRKLEYEIVWLVNDIYNMDSFPKKIRLVQYGTKEAIYEMATAKMWIDNSRKQHYTKKRDEQIYIQTWHGGIALKKIEKDAEEALLKSYIKYAKLDSRNADLFISNSKFNTNLFKNSFWYNGEILESGVPRNDILFNNTIETTKKVKKFFDIEDQRKIILYAPTFRKNNSLESYKFDYEKCVKAFSEKFSDEYVMLVRLHPNIISRQSELNLDSTELYNASLYSDMQELLVAADVLITDYSSSMFEFILTNKPCFIYASDIEEYCEDRGFYFDLKRLPFVISKNTDELLENIKAFNKNEYIDKVKEFIIEQGCKDDGNASKRVVDWIEKNIN